MSTVRFRAADVDLELSGSELFVNRQLRLLSSYLGRVDTDALEHPPAAAQDVRPAAESGPAAAAPAADPAPEPPVESDARMVAELPAAGSLPTNGGPREAPANPVSEFYSRFRSSGPDRQVDAALIFAYYLQKREGLRSLHLRDLIRCCIRAGVDTRNFNRTLGALTRRGFLEPIRHGHAYRLSQQGVTAIESRM